MTWSQESAEILTTVLRNSITVGRVVAMDVDIDAVEQDVLPADEVIEAVLYRRDEGADARLDGAVAKRGTVARIAGGDDDGDRTYRLVFDAPESGAYQVVIHWPQGADMSGPYHHETVAIPGTEDGLLRVK
jgi:hypothetical protein